MPISRIGEMPVPVISILILQTAFCTTAGLSITPSSDLTLQNFSLVCGFDGASWTSSLFFTSDGRSVGACGPPPNPICGSSLGNITTQSTQNVTLTLFPSNIPTYGTALWQCTHTGLSPGVYNATVIAVCSNGEVKQSNDEVDIRCNCGFPSVRATLKYKMSGENKEPKVVDLQTTTGNNCVEDSRAMDFSYKEDISPGTKELCVSFSTLSQISEPEETCQSIGSTTSESSTINLSTEVITTTNSETSSIMSTESLSPTQTSVSLSESTLEGSTLFRSTVSVNSQLETSTALVTASPSGLSEEMTIIVSTVSAVGGILLIVIIVIVVLCCKQRTGIAESEKHRNKHGNLHVKNGNIKDLNSYYDKAQKNKYPDQLRREVQGGTDIYQKHQLSDLILPRSQSYYKQKYIPGNRHQYNAYYPPYTDPGNVMYYQRCPGNGYNEDMLGYSRAGPYRMQQFYPNSYARHDRYTDYRLERKIDHPRG